MSSGRRCDSFDIFDIDCLYIAKIEGSWGDNARAHKWDVIEGTAFDGLRERLMRRGAQQAGDRGAGGFHIALRVGEQLRQAGRSGGDTERRYDAGLTQCCQDLRIACHLASDGDGRLAH